jgi:hypothetical protein
MSDAPGLPRMLAALLGVEPAAASGPRRAQPPAPQPPAPQPSAPMALRRSEREASDGPMRIARRPDPLEQRKEPTPRAPRAPRGGGGSVDPARAPAASVRGEVRRTLRTPEALRPAVVAAEILGSPRALRPYGSGGLF